MKKIRTCISPWQIKANINWNSNTRYRMIMHELRNHEFYYYNLVYQIVYDSNR